MKEYQVKDAHGTKEVEAAMNQMAEYGWEVVSVTHSVNFSYLITFVREKT